jgi:hypothetical protein
LYRAFSAWTLLSLAAIAAAAPARARNAGTSRVRGSCREGGGKISENESVAVASVCSGVGRKAFPVAGAGGGHLTPPAVRRSTALFLARRAPPCASARSSRRKPGGLVYTALYTSCPPRGTDAHCLPVVAEAERSSTLLLRSRSILPEARRPAPPLDPATALAAQASSEVWQPSLCRATVGEDQRPLRTDVGWPRMDEADVAE